MTTCIVEVLSLSGAVRREAALDGERLVIGRNGAGVDLACPEDERMAPDHAHVVATPGGFVLVDRGDPSGVWVRLRGPEGRLLAEGDQLWLGGQLLQVVRGDAGWALRHHGPDGRFRSAHRVPDDGLFIGRTSDLPLDESDGLLSRRHAQVVREGEGLRFYDRGAHNGSYLRVVASEPLGDGDEFRLGANRFRLAISNGGKGAGEGESVEQGIPSRALGGGGGEAGEGDPTDPTDIARGAESTDSDLAEDHRDETTDDGEVTRVDEATDYEVASDRGETAAAELERRLEWAANGDEPAAEGAPDESPVAHAPASPAASGLAARLKKLGAREGATGVAPDDREASIDAATRSRGGGARASEVRGVEPESPSGALSGDASAALGAEPLRQDSETRVVVVLEAGESSVRLEGTAGQTVLEIVREADLERGRFVDWECEDGGCGVCVLSVSDGADRFDPPDPSTGEMKTIQITEQVAPDPKRYRLACLARVRGPVRLRKMT